MTDTCGVSPVIGVILVIAVVALIAAIVAIDYGVIGGVSEVPCAVLVEEE